MMLGLTGFSSSQPEAPKTPLAQARKKSLVQALLSDHLCY